MNPGGAWKGAAGGGCETTTRARADAGRENANETVGSQCLVGGAEGIRTVGLFWPFLPWKSERCRIVFLARTCRPIAQRAIL
jgi:hypothetical protein